MNAERIDARVLGAVRYFNAATGLPVRRSLAVTALAVDQEPDAAAGVSLVRNRRSTYVVAEVVPELAEHRGAFLEPPPEPPLGSVAVELAVRDASGRYLARRHTLLLPRDPDPVDAGLEDSLFRPVDVELLPSPAATTRPGWALIRATVVGAESGDRLPGALIRVLDGGGERIARGLSDWRDGVRGEALVAVPGIPITTWGNGAGDGPVVTHQVPVSVEVTFDPNFDPAGGALPDPDRLEDRPPDASFDFELASGQVIYEELQLPLL
ncbi:MAG: hypothetical protein GY719_38070 [bacterium]|nr:hypothetical protein [bacterium]